MAMERGEGGGRRVEPRILFNGTRARRARNVTTRRTSRFEPTGVWLSRVYFASTSTTSPSSGDPPLASPLSFAFPSRPFSIQYARSFFLF